MNTEKLANTLIEQGLISVEVIPTPCQGAIDFEVTEEEKQEIYNEALTNIWAWCDVEVKVSFAGVDSSEYLGGCNYKSKQQFLDDSYHTGMVYEAVTCMITDKEDLIVSYMKEQHKKLTNVLSALNAE